MPSGLGTVAYVSLAGLIMFLHQFGTIQQYLGLPRDIQFAQFVKDTLDTVLNSSLGQGRTEVFVVGFFWALVGLGVYVFLRGVAKAMFDIGESLDQRGYVWPKGTNRYRPLLDTMQRMGFRFVIALMIIFWLLQPLARVLDGPVFANALQTNPIGLYLLWALTIMLALHVLVILVRLFALRARLFD